VNLVSGDEVVEMAAQLMVVVVVVALDGCFLDGAVHPFDLAVNRHDGCGAFACR
jgi:hypothetical protein